MRIPQMLVKMQVPKPFSQRFWFSVGLPFQFFSSRRRSSQLSYEMMRKETRNSITLFLDICRVFPVIFHVWGRRMRREMRAVSFFISCFTRLCLFPLCKEVNQLSVYYVPSLWDRPPTPLPSHPSRLSRSTRLSSLHHTASSYWLSILHTAIYMFQC